MIQSIIYKFNNLPEEIIRGSLQQTIPNAIKQAVISAVHKSVDKTLITNYFSNIAKMLINYIFKIIQLFN